MLRDVDIPGSIEADRAGRPPAASGVPREMWADRLASLCQGQQSPQGGTETEEPRSWIFSFYDDSKSHYSEYHYAFPRREILAQTCI